MRTVLISIFALVVVGATACGEEESGGEAPGFPDLESGNLAAEALDWVVEGMDCDGEAVTRFVGLVDEEGGQQRRARYFRGDDCVDAGDLFWDELPSQDGDHVSVLVDSEEEEFQHYEVEQIGGYSLRLVGDDELSMRHVVRETSPTPIPDLENFDLAGEWWLEGYPCAEEIVPQLVRVIHPPGNIHVSKLVGDECVGDGVSFLDAEVEGTTILGTAWLDEPPEIPDPDDDDEVEVEGTVRTEDFIRLDVVGQAVSLRRVDDEG